ncbi:hypothetical protein B296_00047164 [Ensete ventricosum]|uniref:Uncharacterized protein n=1 Tax=Ensete ventricosum TaxID=4639 RepID=A0A426YRZ8_ENSVE|nr:hypothetical protein B296_00047164 [Ensete ventricosum]
MATLASEVESRPFQLGGQVDDNVYIRGGEVRTSCHLDSPSTRHECRMTHHILAHTTTPTGLGYDLAMPEVTTKTIELTPGR